MILKNPTNGDISVKIEGREYTCKAGATVSLPNHRGMYWKTKLHAFMEIVSEEETVDVDVVEPVAPVVEDEVKADAPEVSTEPDGTKVRAVEGTRRPKK